MTYDLGGDEKSAFNVYTLRKSLTATGFEHYVSLFFQKILKYKTNIPTKIYSSDGGIDIECFGKDKYGVNNYGLIQCKKHSKTNFGINDISSFFGRIHHKLLDFSNTKVFFITTSSFTLPAIKYAEEEGIILKDFRNVANMLNLYSLSDFEKDVKLSNFNYNDLFNKCREVKISSSQGKLFSSEEDEIIRTLKDIRFTIMKNSNNKSLESYGSDNILEFISIKRPHNFESLKISLYEGNFAIGEINKILPFANEYLKGINLYLHSSSNCKIVEK